MSKDIRTIEILQNLAKSQPNALLLEGGTSKKRFFYGKYWAQLVNCLGLKDCAPCLKCSACIQIDQEVYPEFIVLGNEEKSILIDEVHEVCAKLGDSVRTERRRVILIFEAQNLTKEASNALLKSVEDPGLDNLFVFTVPYRTSILATLVSRSFIHTLPWEHTIEMTADIAEYLQYICSFAQQGCGLINFTNNKSKITVPFANSVLQALLYMSLEALQQQTTQAMSIFFAKNFSLSQLRQVERAILFGLQYLDNNGGAGLALEWVALNLWKIFKQGQT